MPANQPTTYRVTQYARPDENRPPRNIGVTDLESLVTHHPVANRRARLVNGVPEGVEHDRNRSYAVVGGELQEVQALRTDRKYRSLAPDQVLLIKDFILDDPTVADSRRVDVPAPVAGIVGRVDSPNGVVDLIDPATSSLIARMRHLDPIAVKVGEHIAYGQALGTQSNAGLLRTAGKHVHIEMDTRYYQQFDHYVRDLVEGRLPGQAAHRAGVEPRPVVDDGVLRVGGSGERIAMVQRALVAGGYRAVGDAPIEVDGVYRLSMQGAVLSFQADHGLAPTADIDAPTWRTALDRAFGKPLLPPPVIDFDSAPRPAPGQFRLLDQIRGHIRDYEASRGDAFGADGERLALALAGRAAEQRMTSADHLLVAPAVGLASIVERVSVVQGRLDDPAQYRASMSVAEALASSPLESLHRLRAIDAPGGAGTPSMPVQHGAMDPHRMSHGI